ncbi:uncharacterized protein L203_100854 [Cryptococcus depauperatus CBS 7841]|uniref:Uncharacterized protein n=1 Tax=Cryptococcus depauperatus CBS 7841 TaxID=1295531 RepID=A0AAJ8JNW4_9TREE
MAGNQNKPRLASPSLELLLESLRAHLQPTPIKALLPSCLNIFAHLLLFSRQLASDASDVLETQREWDRYAEQKGSNRKVNRAESMLDEMERMRIQKVANASSRREEIMVGLSIEMRKHHIAHLLANLKSDPLIIRPTLDLYFPPRLETMETSKNAELFISSMTEREVRLLHEERLRLEEWQDDAEQMFKAKELPLRYEAYFSDGINSTQHGNWLGRSMVVLAEHIVQDAHDCTVNNYRLSLSPSGYKRSKSKRPRQPLVGLPTALRESLSPDPVHVRSLPRLAFTNGSNKRLKTGVYVKEEMQDTLLAEAIQRKKQMKTKSMAEERMLEPTPRFPQQESEKQEKSLGLVTSSLEARPDHILDLSSRASPYEPLFPSSSRLPDHLLLGQTPSSSSRLSKLRKLTQVRHSLPIIPDSSIVDKEEQEALKEWIDDFKKA